MQSETCITEIFSQKAFPSIYGRASIYAEMTSGKN
jgi:hypothetical protein